MEGLAVRKLDIGQSQSSTPCSGLSDRAIYSPLGIVFGGAWYLKPSFTTMNSDLKELLLVIALSILSTILFSVYGLNKLGIPPAEHVFDVFQPAPDAAPAPAPAPAPAKAPESNKQSNEAAQSFVKPAFLRVVPAQSIMQGMLLGAFKSDLPGVTDGNPLPYRRYAAVGLFDALWMGNFSIELLAQNKPAPMPYGGFTMPNQPYQQGQPSNSAAAANNNPVFTGTVNPEVSNGPQFGWQQQMQVLPYGVNDMVIESFNGNPNVVENLMRTNVNQALHDQINHSLQQ